MQTIFNFINIPLSYLLKFIANIFNGNFAAAVFIFTLLINLVLLPLSIKSQKSTVQQTRLKPKLDQLKKRYGDDKQKYSMAMQELYQKEGVSMSGGCLPMLFRLLLMMSIYWLILSPITYLAGVDKSTVQNVSSGIVSSMNKLQKEDSEKFKEISKEIAWKSNSTSNELVIVRLIRQHPEVIHEIMSDEEFAEIEKDFNTIIEKDKKSGINFKIFGINLTETPRFSWDIFGGWQRIWLIPICAFLAQMLTSVLSMYAQKKNNPEAPSMAFMMLSMPLVSLFIGFGLPGGVGFYWICSSLVGGFIQYALQVFYGPYKLLSRERAKELSERYDFEKKQIEKLSGEQPE